MKWVNEKSSFTFLIHLEPCPKMKDTSLRTVFSFCPFYSGFWPQIQMLVKETEWLSSLLGDPNWDSGLQRDPKERVMYARPSDVLWGPRTVGNRQGVYTCLAKEEKNVGHEKKIEWRTSLANNHSPPPLPHPPPGRGPDSCSTCPPPRARQGQAGAGGTVAGLRVSRPGHC